MRPNAGTADLSLWSLPLSLPVGGRQEPIRGDFRVVLQVMEELQNEELPRFIRWRRALRRFYRRPIPEADRQEAMERLAEFITCGQEEEPGPRLIDWEHDAGLIASEVNRVAGREVRQLKFVHWWTFLGWFHAIGPGALSSVVAIREKLAAHKRLTPEEQAYYRKHRARIRLPESRQVREEKMRLEELLKGGRHGDDPEDQS